MRRRRFWFALLLLVGTLVAFGGGLAVAAKYEPGFYATAGGPAGWETGVAASQLITRVQDLKNDVRSKPEWGASFRAADLNCFFQDTMSRKGGGLCSLLPNGFHSPRVSIDGDRLRIGMKYGEGFWSTVAWVEMKVWLVDGETNVVAVELCDLRAGGLPVGSSSVLEGISELARDSNVEVTWYRHGSNPVGLFKFYADQPRANTQIQRLDVQDGTITLAGRSLDATPAVAPGGAGVE